MHLRTFSSKFFVVLASLIVLGARAAAADTLTVMWDPNPEPEVTGYIVHVGTQPGTYTQNINVGLSTSYAFSSAVAGQQYCFAVSAYVAGPLEGALSSEVCGYSNQAPTLTQPANQVSVRSQAATLQLQGVDPDGQPLTYSAAGLPAGLSLMASTGFISGSPTTAGTYNITATVSDGVLSASRSFTWTVTAPDTTVPVVTITGPTSAATYSTTSPAIALSGSATDNVGVTQVTWVNNLGGTGTATGTASWSVASVTMQPGANVITVTARDAAGNTSTDVVTVTYTVNVNVAPTLTNPGARSNSVAQPLSLQLAGSDLNGDTLSYTASGLPPGLSLTAATGGIAGTPLMTGAYAVTATVSDGALSASQSFTWTIAASATGTGSIQLLWDANTEPGVAGYYVHAGVQTGVYVQKIDAGLASSFTFANAVIGQRYCFAVSAYFAGPVEGPRSAEACGYANTAPVLAAVSNQSSNVGQTVSLQLTGSDPEGSPLTYTASGLPAGLSVVASTGLISGAPTTAGSYSVTANVSDGALSASRSFAWTIAAPADTTAPVVTITGPTSAATWTTASTSVTLSGTASDAVGVTQVTWVNSRGGSGTATGTTSWTGSITLQSGTNALTVTARDAAGNTSTDVLTVTVNVNAAPTLAAVAAQTSSLGAPASLQLVGGDPNNDPISYAISGLPPGLSVNSSTGLISGTPTTAGTYSVTAGVWDGALAAQAGFTWTITADTTAPAVAISGPTSAATYTTTASSLLLNGTASDAVGVTQVSWVNSRGGSGTATGTTTWSAAGVALLAGQNVITVSARDAAGNVGTDVITITRNVAPALAAVADNSSEVGVSASVQLTGSDADGDLLTYGANGLPPGTALTVATGLISGTPTQTGTYVVTATVFDGAQSASQTFTWTVTPDVTVPSVAITAPTSAATYASNSNAVTLSGSSSDSVGVTQVSWVTNRGGSGIAAGTTSWNSGVVTLQSGVNVITVTARDAAGNIATSTLTVTVNVAPALASVANQSTEAGVAASLQLIGSDADGDVLTYTATGLPGGVTLGTSGLISGVPTVAGTYTVVATVSDAAQSATRTFTWTVTPDVTVPAIAISGPTTGGAYTSPAASLTLSGTSSDRLGVTQVTWSNDRGGNGTASGTTTWSVPGVVLQNGANVISVTARDAAGNTAVAVLTVTFTPPDVTAPSITITGPTSASTLTTTSSSMTLSGVASDAIGVTQVSWSNDRGGSGTATGTTAWSVASVTLQSGANLLTVTARDAAGNTATDVVTVTYSAPSPNNVAPTLAAVANRTTYVGDLRYLQLVGADANGDVLTYTATGLPPGFSVNPSTGLISGTATTTGTYRVTVSVSDGRLSKSQTFTWTVARY